MIRTPARRSLALAILTAALSTPALAVIVPAGDGHNNTADSPTPSSLDSYVGTFGGFTGTPISSRYFVTAHHIGRDATTGTFTFNNGTPAATTYSVVRAGVQDDLAIWRIADADPNTFSLFAPLYLNQDEQANPLVVLGRGTLRGDPVLNSSSQPVGWRWSDGTNALSWGTNTVDRFETVDPADLPDFGGSLIAFTFDNNGNPNEAALTGGDSGGPVFVLDPADNTYKLAGVNSLIDGPFATTPSTNAADYFNASLFDARGFYAEGENGPELIAGPNPIPTNSYATRISTRLDFISTTTGIPVPEPTTTALLLLTAPALLTRRRRQRA